MNLGPAEIIVILVVALLVFGPKKLPEVGRQVGRAMREMRRFQDHVRREIDDVLAEEPTPRPKPGAVAASATPAAAAPATPAAAATPSEPAPRVEPDHDGAGAPGRPAPDDDGPSGSFL